MFPIPVEKLPKINQYRYRLFLYLSVILWLLPLIAIMLVSFRSLSDLNAGNYYVTVQDNIGCVDSVSLATISLVSPGNPKI